MKTAQLIAAAALALAGSAACAAEQGTTRVTVLATGGTIAGAQAPEGGYGYKSGSFDIKDLIAAVPNLDKLAQGGARLEQYYAQPMCTPSRAACRKP